MRKHKLSLWQRKLRSIIKRFLISFVNQSDSFVIQHLPEFIKDINFSTYRKIWIHENRKNNDVDLIRMLFLICSVEEILSSNIKGSFAELGVYKGNSAKILNELAPKRNLYLFDTFEGFLEKDTIFESKKINKRHFKDTSLENIKNLFKSSENVYLCPGYFPETTCSIPKKETFSLVHLDADLYNPTKSALKFFYPKLEKGAFLIVHDYLNESWPGVRKAVDEFFQDKIKNITRIPDKSGSIVIRKF
jgi:O-methyltransferase